MKTTTMTEEQRNILDLCQGLTDEEKTLVILKILEIKSRRKKYCIMEDKFNSNGEQKSIILLP